MKKSKKCLIQICLLIVMVVVLILTLSFFFNSMNHIQTKAIKGEEENRAELESSILENFEYKRDEAYLITEKRMEKEPIFIITGFSYVDVYVLVGLKGEEVYELRVPSKLYYQTIAGEKLSVQEGDIDIEKISEKRIGNVQELHQISLTSDGKEVIYRELIEESLNKR